jgi:hypothetical protein
MIFENSSLKTLIITNFILSIFSIVLILIFISFWAWTRIQNVRKELRSGKDNSIFPIADKCSLTTGDNSHNNKIEDNGNIFITPVSVSVSPSSLLAKSLTSADFVAKSLLDKKVFAASGQVYKSPSVGLKDLI